MGEGDGRSLVLARARGTKYIEGASLRFSMPFLRRFRPALEKAACTSRILPLRPQTLPTVLRRVRRSAPRCWKPTRPPLPVHAASNLS